MYSFYLKHFEYMWKEYKESCCWNYAV